MGAPSGSGAAKRAEKAEKERQEGIKRAVARINAIFDSPDRQSQFGRFGDALRAFFGEQLERQRSIADRNLRFGMARAGQTGGSLAADAGRTLADEQQRAVLDAERRTQGSVNELRQADQTARQGLFQLAQQGLDATQAARQSGEAMRLNLAQATADSRAQGLGDLFGATSDIYKRQQEAAMRRQVLNAPTGGYYTNWGGRV